MEGGAGPQKALKMRDFQMWEGPKVLKLLDFGNSAFSDNEDKNR